MKNNIDTKYYENKELKYLAGLDEAGRGSLAGPIVVACVILPKYYFNDEINDSKILSKNTRKKLYYKLLEDALDYSITIIDSNDVEKFNPKKSSILGMEKCIDKLNIKPDFIITDAEKLDKKYNHHSIIKGDKLSQSIAASSIIAKYYRDNLMEKYDLQYPGYDFKNNKGYGTKKHLEALDKIGISKIHRKTYKPVIEVLNKEMLYD